MVANLDKLSEMGKLLSLKDEVCVKMVTYFGLMGLGRMLSRLSLEKQQGVSIAQLILSPKPVPYDRRECPLLMAQALPRAS